MQPRPRVVAASAVCGRRPPEKTTPPFSWQLREASLALAPWTSDARRQAFVRAAVAVAEQSAPQYSLTFTVSVEHSDLQSCGAGARNGKKTVQTTRKVTKQHMVCAFERAVSDREEDANFARLKTRRLSSEPSRTSGDVDDAVRQWLLRGQAAPSRRETVLWLLSRMLLVPKRDATDRNGERSWELQICGEAGAEIQQPIEEISARASRQKRSDTEGVQGPACNDDDDDLPEYRDPSRYTRGLSGSESERADNSDGSGEDELDFDAAGGGDEHVAPGASPDESMANCEDTKNATGKVDTRSSSTVFASTAATRAKGVSKRDADDDQDNDVVERRRPSRAQLSESEFAFEPAALRTRHRSASASHLSRSASALDADLANEWTQDRRSFQLELRRSKKDIRDARELQRRTEAVAHLRKQQLQLQSQRKLRAHDQRREDASAVTQLVSDALEYHDILRTLETQVKRTTISAKREQERLTQSVRVAIGRGDRHVRGPILGPGPLSQLEIDAHSRRGRSSGGHHQRECEGDSFVYDLHGRRHAAEASGDVAALGVFAAAMRKIKRALDRTGTGDRDLLHLFRECDADRSGTLSRREFERVLGACGVALSQEQVRVLFEHFDPNGSGAIDYGELLWGFFNRRAFLKKWQLRKTKLAPRDVKLLFYQYDRAGRGALSRRDFQLAMDDLGFQVADDELKLLVLKFDANRDDFIDYHEFHAFVSDGAVESAGEEENRRQSVGQAPRERSPSASAEWILAELRALSESQTRL